MRPKPLINPNVHQQGMGERRAQHRNEGTRDVREFTTGVITAAYPIDHPQNGLRQVVYDVFVGAEMPHWRRVPMATPYAHQETEIEAPNSKNRQPYAPKARNRIDGRSSDLRPGTKVRIGYVGGDLEAPIILECLRMNLQPETGGALTEKQYVDIFDGSGKLLSTVLRAPLDSTLGEYPRQVDGFNGTRTYVDNRGNLYVQSTNDQAPVFPGHNGIPASPEPQGNIGFSTRGAKMGNQGRVTGSRPEANGETNSDGSIRDETVGARLGHYVVRLRSLVGRLYGSTRGSGDGRVYLETADRSYMALSPDGHAELHGEQKVTLDADTVNLGNDAPPYTAVLWEVLNDFLEEFIDEYDGHAHGGVTEGNDDTDAPTSLVKVPIWIAKYQRGKAYQSDNVHLVKADPATPEPQDDPHGES